MKQIQKKKEMMLISRLKIKNWSLKAAMIMKEKTRLEKRSVLLINWE